MMISTAVLGAFARLPYPPPEIGGLIGGTDDEITEVFVDEGGESARPNRYRPKTCLLNSVIRHWSTAGIEFRGVFHTHFAFGYEMSDEDRQYANTIMAAMPPRIGSLLFPVVVPGHAVSSYLMTRERGQQHLKLDSFHMFEEWRR